MGTLRYPGAPDFTYGDQTLANLQQIITIQQKMGQGFWLERQGMDEGGLMGHDAVWISPEQPIYIEFDGLDQVAPEASVVEHWRMLLVVEGSDRLVIHPPPEVMEIVRHEWERNAP